MSIQRIEAVRREECCDMCKNRTKLKRKEELLINKKRDSESAVLQRTLWKAH